MHLLVWRPIGKCLQATMFRLHTPELNPLR